MAKIIRNKTISQLDASTNYEINTLGVSSKDTLIVNINHESKLLRITYHFKGSDIAQKSGLHFNVKDSGSQLIITWHGAQPIKDSVKVEGGEILFLDPVSGKSKIRFMSSEEYNKRVRFLFNGEKILISPEEYEMEEKKRIERQKERERERERERENLKKRNEEKKNRERQNKLSETIEKVLRQTGKKMTTKEMADELNGNWFQEYATLPPITEKQVYNAVEYNHLFCLKNNVVSLSTWWRRNKDVFYDLQMFMEDHKWKITIVAIIIGLIVLGTLNSDSNLETQMQAVMRMYIKNNMNRKGIC